MLAALHVIFRSAASLVADERVQPRRGHRDLLCRQEPAVRQMWSSVPISAAACGGEDRVRRRHVRFARCPPRRSAP